MTQQTFIVDYGLQVETTASTIILGEVGGSASPGLNSTSSIELVTDSLGTTKSWTFATNGNLTAPGSIITSSGQGGNISGANVIGANTVVVSGNITGGNIETTGYLGANSVGVSTSVATRTLVTDPVSFVDLTAVFGARAFISDANRAAVGNFGAQVSGGGSNNVPIWSDGANWYIG